MIESVRLAAQIGVFVALCAGVAALADRPRYYQIPAGSGIIKLSFTHGSNRQAECRRRTPEELAKLPPNMRKPLDCPRTRGPELRKRCVAPSRCRHRTAIPPA